ncbi:MAG: 3-phosphoshikimate 1-carboxyvinyltransferase [Lachnospiraceae bacterium]|nr:3-phosphoshikimate 1-carboxyvinyltransferase [Lachnospiraceae bacterium]
MRTLKKAAGPLTGSVLIPGDKSISHRAVMFGAIAQGTTRIRHFLSGADCLSTIDCFRRLGIEIELKLEQNGQVLVHGKGLRGLCAPDPMQLDTGNSGTTTRILSGILAPQSFSCILSGDESINRRPMKRVMEPLSLMGASIESMNGSGCAPLLIRGKNLQGISYRSPVASAQVKSAILCAGLYADGETRVTEPARSRDHTERMLASFGASLTCSSEHADFTGAYTAAIRPARELYAQDIVVPGDISSAAYFIAAALMIPQSRVLVRGVGINPTRAGFLTAVEKMGAQLTYYACSDNPDTSGALLGHNLSEALDALSNTPGEPACDLLVNSSRLHGITIEGSIIPALIDEIPILAVLAACAEGETVIRDAAELKVKESDRIASVTENLRAMGVEADPAPDGMIIAGRHSDGPAFHGGLIHTCADHRIAMSFAVAALAAEGDTVLDDADCVSISYPAFFADLEALL